MSAQINLATLNAFRANEGKAPYASWKASRHQPMLDAYKADVAKRAVTTKGIAVNDIEVAGAASMRPMNDALALDIKETRIAWKSSGANMTKKEFAFNLLQVGTTIKNMSDKMGITPTAARSLIGDVRRMSGVTVDRKDDVYFAIVEQEDEEGEE